MAAYPVLFLYQANTGEVNLRDVVPILIGSIAFAAVCIVVARRMTGEWLRAATATTAFIALFFLYGRVWTAVKGRQVGSIIVDRDLYFIPFWLLIMFGVLATAARPRVRMREITKILNAATAVLVVMSLAGLATASEGAGLHEPILARIRSAGSGTPDGVVPVRAPAKPRDIYYLIFDRYAGQAALQQRFGFDNEAFYRRLRDRGFTVPTASLTNYPKTNQSLAASLNLTYLDPLSRLGATNNLKPLRELVRDNVVLRTLRPLGYRYIQVGSSNSITSFNPYATRNVRFDTTSDFARVMYETTLALPIGSRLGLDPRRHEWERTRFQFDQLEASPTWAGPKFVFAHILLPHDPYIFHRDGSYRPEGDALSSERDPMYLEQVDYTNQRISRLLDRLMAAPVDERPIIILQADEGPHPFRIDLDQNALNWYLATDEDLVEKFPILNAYYFPGIDDRDVADTISPVNAFRVVLDRYFGATLSLLPDRSYIFRDAKHPYTFTDVTDRVRRAIARGDRRTGI
jgi:hypothetical protein